MAYTPLVAISERPTLRALPGGGEAKVRRPSDEEILAGLLRGDYRAADALYDRVHLIVERTLRRVLHARSADYDDLVQVTFEQIVRTLTSRKFAQACSLTTWASAIAGHVGIDALRVYQREQRFFTETNSPLDPSESAQIFERNSLERQLEARSEIERVQTVLSQMSLEQAETLVLHDLLGHDLSEIAVIESVSVAAAQTRLVRGRKDFMRRIRQLLEGAS